MHFERLAIEAGANTFTLDLHDRLTVVAGMGRLERDGLVKELVSGLSAGRPGVHLEVRSDAGDRYAIFRPSTGPARVVDIEHACDVTERFTDDQGVVNILERSGLTLSDAKRAVRITASDLVTKSDGDAYLEQLARIDPNRLWDVARKVVDSDARLAQIAESVGSAAEDVEAFEEIDRRHQESEAAISEAESIRAVSFLIATLSALAALPGMFLLGAIVTLPLLLVAGGAGWYSLNAYRTAEAARRKEEDALALVGAKSYMSFQVSRVNDSVATEGQKQRLLAAAAAHRSALAQWELLAGDVPPDWALEHRREIVATHARLREVHGANPGTALTVAAPDGGGRGELEQAIEQQLTKIRRLGAGGESFPAFLDDPFVDLPAEQKTEMLRLVSRASKEQQIILLTSDPDVVTWARLEALSGDLALVEPAGHSQAGDGEAPKRSRHVVA